MTVPRSYAYEHIDDPSDPAWVGHLDPSPRFGRVRVALAVVGVMAVAAATAWLVFGTGSEQDGESSRQRPARGTGAPVDVAVPRVDVVPPASPAAAGDAESPSSSEQLASHFGTAPTTEYVLAPRSNFGDPDAVTGKDAGLGPSLSAGLEGLAVLIGKPLTVISGNRTRDEQEALYRRFLAGTGNLAAVPGTSRHETGDAADVYIDGVALASYPGARAKAESLGLGFPVPGEPWHVERMPAR